MIILFPQGAFSGDNEAHFKGAVSRNLSKYTIVEIATKTERNKKYLLRTRNEGITQYIQRQEQMGKLEDSNVSQLRFLKTSWSHSFSKFISVLCNV